jgi:hypothetical protein
VPNYFSWFSFGSNLINFVSFRYAHELNACTADIESRVSIYRYKNENSLVSRISLSLELVYRYKNKNPLVSLVPYLHP